MLYFQRAYLADEALPHDEIDDLFEKLQPVQPPPSLIQRILNSVNQLPRHPLAQQPQSPLSLDSGAMDDIDGLDSLVVRKEGLPPS